MIELDDFVKSTLVAIVRGVTSAQAEAEKLGGRINPQRMIPPSQMLVADKKSMTVIQDVEFDVAVTATESTGVSGGVRLGIQVLSVGAGTKSDAGQTSTNRIRFHVPVAFPPHHVGAKTDEAPLQQPPSVSIA